MLDFAIKFCKSQIDDSGNLTGQFRINNLKVGQGITIGNILRRVLLKDLIGTAVTQIKISSVKHEFSNLEGIREDILEIILNLKKVIIKNKNNQPGSGTLKIFGPAIVTASAIKISDNLEIINPNHYIATISDRSLLDLEIDFECGTGYKLADNTKNNSNNGKINIDAIFMPIQKVNYRVEYISETMTESLIMDVTTNNTITPQEALSEGLKSIIHFFSDLLNNEISSDLTSIKLTDQIVSNEINVNIPIEDLEFSVRTYNCLKRAQINTLAELLKYSPKDLKKIRNFGQKSIDEVLGNLKNKFQITLLN
jgi:DNA-directed RNA polymerase subunit alpha